MRQTPPPDRQNGGRLAILGALLAYIDKPWKAVAIGGLAIVFGLGWLVWTERAQLLGVLLRPAPHPSVLKAQLLPELNGVLADSTADIVTVWRVDLAANTLNPVLSTGRHGGRLPAGVEGTAPVLTERGDLRKLTRLFNGETVCGPTSGGLLSRRLAGAGYRFECVTPIPPGANQIEIGVLILLWQTPPDEAEQTAVRTVATVAADRMVTR